MITRPARLGFAAAATVAALTLTGCVANNASETTENTITVDSSANDCSLSANEAPSGNLVFSVTNSGDQVTEFYLLGDDGLRIIGEVENIGPGITRELVVRAKPGDYFTVCKPGLTGEGVGKAAFTVTDSGDDLSFSGDVAERVEAANANYKGYVTGQIKNLAVGAGLFGLA